MASSHIKFPIWGVVKDMTMYCEITVTGMRWYMLRLKLAKPLLRMAAWIIGCRIEIRA
jgi:hypothetical protein